MKPKWFKIRRSHHEERLFSFVSIYVRLPWVLEDSERGLPIYFDYVCNVIDLFSRHWSHSDLSERSRLRGKDWWRCRFVPRAPSVDLRHDAIDRVGTIDIVDVDALVFVIWTRGACCDRRPCPHVVRRWDRLVYRESEVSR